MDNLTPSTTIAAEGVALLLSQFRSQGNVPDFLQAFLDEVQAAETAITGPYADLYLATATGWALDQLGELVGMPRPTHGAAATDDAEYRVLIYGQIAANVSHGTLPDLYNILRSLGLTSVRLFEVYPASLTVNYVGTPTVDDCGCVRAILERATPPIELDITSHSEAPFGFEGDRTAYGFDEGELGDSL